MPSKSGAGPRKHGKNGALPKHQNSFAFKHNPNSRKTEAIFSIDATHGCCSRCSAIIEWKRKYRKYKPLAKPRKCTGCHGMTLRLAYHSLCGGCVGARGVCAKCGQGREAQVKAALELEALSKQIDMLSGTRGSIPGFTERERRSTLRELLRDRARILELSAEEAEEEGQALDAEAAAAEAGKAVKKEEKALRKKEWLAGGGAQVEGGKWEEEEGEEEEEEEEEEEGDEEEEEEGEEEEEEEEEEEAHVRPTKGFFPRRRVAVTQGEVVVVAAAAAAPPPKAAAKAATAAAASASSGGGGGAAKKAPSMSGGGGSSAFGSSPDDQGLVDPAVFSRALKEAQRRAKELGM